MAYTTLYRKFRPQVFADVYGQDHIITALCHQLQTGRIGHAYLFTGTRGTGKTTIAKILAKALNCEQPKEDGTPCGECASCKRIADNASLSVIEIDGASNNGIDNIRSIIEEISYPPVDGKYKVYTIDEVHAISSNAFQALLKTLEEPPSYVVFILATTEVAKLPITILSRCQRYDFHRISVPVIEARLQQIITAEGLSIEDRAVRYVAKMADGSMRDALSLLDQGVVFSMGETLTYERMLEVLGAVDTAVFSKILRAIHANDIANALSTLDRIMMEGKEPTTFASDFVWYLRNLLLLKSGEDLENILDISQENQALLVEEADLISENDLMRYIRVLSDAIAQLKFAAVKRVTIEIAIMRLCKPQMETDVNSLLARIEALERGAVRISDDMATAATNQPSSKAVSEEPPWDVSKENETDEIQQDVVDDTKRSSLDVMEENKEAAPSFWSAILQGLTPLLRSQLTSATVTLEDEDHLLIGFSPGDIGYTFFGNAEKLKQLEDIVEKEVGKHIAIKVTDSAKSKGKQTESAIERFEQKTGIKVETEDF